MTNPPVFNTLQGVVVDRAGMPYLKQVKRLRWRTPRLGATEACGILRALANLNPPLHYIRQSPQFIGGALIGASA